MLRNSPVTVIGVSESHCATARLLRDGKEVACVSEERLNRLKNWGGVPSLAVQEVLQLAGLEADEVDRLILHGRSPWMYGWYSGENVSSSESRRLMSLRTMMGKTLYRSPAAWSAYRFARDTFYRARPRTLEPGTHCLGQQIVGSPN